MQLTATPYTLQLRHTFTLSSSSRTTTPVILVELAEEGYVGYGEASLPPYLHDTQESVLRFIARCDLSQFGLHTPLSTVLSYVQLLSTGNTAAKAAIDIALHDLYGKAAGQAWWQHWQLDRYQVPTTSYTIGIGSPEEICQKTLEAAPYGLIKVKLGCAEDKMIIETIRSVTNTPICIDVNQGWTDKHYALEMLHWCHQQGVIFAEQPMPRHLVDEMAWLTAHAPIPTIADESFQRLTDLDAVKGVFSGVNIKLMKCTGMDEAYRIATEARALGMKVMLGCMTETSCAISAAAQLSPMADWCDLDGNLLINNDPFEGATVEGGRVIASSEAGIGVRKRC